MDITSPSQLDRLEHLLLSQFFLTNYWSSRMTIDLSTLQAQVAALTTAAAADRVRAEAGAAQVTQAVSLLQSLKATVDQLRDQLAGGDAVTQEQVNAMTAQLAAGLSELEASAAAESAADLQLAAGVVAASGNDTAAGGGDTAAGGNDTQPGGEDTAAGGDASQPA